MHFNNFIPNISQTNYDAQAYFIQYGYNQNRKLTYVARFEDISFGEDNYYFQLLGISPAQNLVLTANYRLEDSNGIHVEIKYTDSVQAHTIFTLQWYYTLL